ncbi:MAG: hypothetical protein Q8L86_04685 [Vicinamibacterales bacterium]|nr:hypothetical protein [Vicinamibacterales bacterium]
MDRDTLRQFVRRDWSAVATSKARFWHTLKARSSAAEVLGIGDVMRSHAQALRPGWPSRQHRLDDLLVHQRVGEALRAVACRPR